MNLTPDLETIEIPTVSRDGMPVLLITAFWQGQVIEVDTYRASDLAKIDSTLLEVKGGK